MPCAAPYLPRFTNPLLRPPIIRSWRDAAIWSLESENAHPETTRFNLLYNSTERDWLRRSGYPYIDFNLSSGTAEGGI